MIIDNVEYTFNETHFEQRAHAEMVEKLFAEEQELKKYDGSQIFNHSSPNERTISLENFVELKITKRSGSEKLEIFLNLLKAVKKLHSNNVLIRCFHPNFIFINAHQQILFTNFLYSPSLHDKPLDTLVNSTLLDKYVSPEVKYKSLDLYDIKADIYALGILFHELLFEREVNLSQSIYKADEFDFLDTSPDEIDLHKALFNVVTKMTIENSGLRYQFLNSIIHDLIAIKKHNIVDFEAGELEKGIKRKIDGAFIGRKQESIIISNFFKESHKEGKSKILHFYGVSGIGKSRTVYKSIESLDNKPDFILRYKFNDNSTFSSKTLTQNLLNSFLQELRLSPKKTYDEWTKFLNEEFEPIKSTIIDLVGDFDEILHHKIESHQTYDSVDLQMSYVLKQILVAFKKKGITPVLIFDDIQWADNAAAFFIKRLMDSINSLGCLIILIGRNKLKSDSTFQSEKGIPSKQIEGFTIQELKRLLEGIFITIDDNVVREVWQLGAGNPFFSKEIIKHFLESNVLYKDHSSGKWSLSKEIEHKGFNWAQFNDFLIYKLMSYPKDLQNFLSMASVQGYEFHPNAAFDISSDPSNERLDSIITKLKDENIIAPSTNGKYEFIHDKVYSTIYDLIKRSTKYKDMLLKTREYFNQKSEKDYSILGHLYIELYQIESSLVNSKELFDTALTLYDQLKFEISLKVFELCFKKLYKKQDKEFFTVDKKAELHLKLAELSNIFSKSDLFWRHIRLAEAENTQNKKLLTQISLNKISTYYNENNLKQAVDEGIYALKREGLHLKQSYSKLEVVWLIIKSKFSLPSRVINKIEHLPFIKNEAEKNKLDILSALVSPAFFTSKELILFIAYNQIRLSLKHGVYENSPNAYITWSAFLISVLNDIKTGSKLGEIARRLSKKDEFKKSRSNTELIYQFFIRHWTNPIHLTSQSVQNTFNLCMSLGDVENAFNAAFSTHSFIVSGHPIQDSFEKVNEYLEWAETYKNKKSFEILYFFKSVYATLSSPDAFKKHNVKIIELETFSRKIESPNHKQRVHLFLAYLYFLTRSKSEALIQIKEASSLYEYSRGSSTNVFLIFLESIIHIDNETKETPRIVRKNLKKLSIWAKFNVEHKDKVEFIKAIYKFKYPTGLDVINKCIESANKFNNIHIAGIYCMMLADRIPDIKLEELYYESAQDYFNKWGLKTNLTLSRKQEIDLSDEMKSDFVLGLTKRILLRKSKDSALNDYTLGIKDYLHAKKVAIISLDDDKLRLEAIRDAHAYNYFENALEIPYKSLDVPLQMLEYCHRTKDKIYIPNAHQKHIFDSSFYFKHSEAISILAVPLMNHNKIEGILYIESDIEGYEYTDYQINNISLINSIVGLLIDNTKLYNELEEKVKERTLEVEQKNADIQKINEGLEENVKNRTSELVALNKELNTFLYHSSHELRGPIARMAGLSQLKKLQNQFDEVDALYLNEINKVDFTLRRVLIVDEIRKENAIERIDINDFYDNFIEAYPEIDDSCISLNSSVEILTCNHYLLSLILKETIKNAFIFNPKKEKRVDIKISKSLEEQHIIISDNGEGIEKKFQDDIFQMFKKCSIYSKGEGLGLYLVKKSIERLKGRIWVDYEHSENNNYSTSIHITIPNH